MPKHLSRLTAQDQVLTANDLFDPENRPHGKVMALAETKSLVDHSTQAHIFATKAELDAFVAEQSALSEAERTVKVGDNLYITDTGVPDYWWMGEAPWVSELETGAVKVNVDNALDASSSNPIANRAVTAKTSSQQQEINALRGDVDDVRSYLFETNTMPAPAGDVDAFGYRGTLADLGVYGAGIKIYRLSIITRNGTNQNSNVALWARVLKKVSGNWAVCAQAKSSRRWNEVGQNQELAWEMEPVAGVTPPTTDEEIAIVWVNNANAAATSLNGSVSFRTTPGAGGIGSESLTATVQGWKPVVQFVYQSIALPTSGGEDLSQCTDIAIGEGATITLGENAIAIGESASAEGLSGSGNGGVAIGYASKAAAYAVAIGGRYCSDGMYGAVATCSGDIAIGAATAAAGGSVMIGYNVGCMNSMPCSVIVGGSPGYQGERVTLIGSGARGCSGAVYTVAVGTRAAATGNYSTAVGASACACEDGVIAVGYDAKSDAPDGIAIGRSTRICAYRSVVIGNCADSGASCGVVIGSRASSCMGSGGSIVIGADAKAKGGGVVIGEGAHDSDLNTSLDAVVIGKYASGAAPGASVIGNDTSNGAATSIMLSAADPSTGYEAFLRIGVCNSFGCGASASFLDVGVVDRLNATHSGVRVPLISFINNLLGGVNGATEGVPDMVIGSCCSY